MFSEQLENVLGKSIDLIAKETGFCTRKRKLSAGIFLNSLLFKSFDGSNQSLNDHALTLLLEKGLCVKKQSIHDRFNSKAVNFLKSILANLLNQNLKSNSAFGKFTSVFIQDGTRFGLPHSMKENYPGFGGRSKMEAGAQVQLVYELKKSTIQHCSILAATENEAKAVTGCSWIIPGSLVLRDLGYFVMDGLKDIIAKQAYFVSRVKPKTVLYHDNKNGVVERIDLTKIVSRMKRNKINQLSLDILLSTKDQIPVKAYISLLPKPIEENRVRKARYIAKTRNWNVKDEFLTWASINVFITNAPSSMIDQNEIQKIYGLRWQIELIFKSWKSHFKFHLHKKIKKERLECYLYTSLIYFVIQWRLHQLIKEISQIQISLLKFSKTVIHLRDQFQKLLESPRKYSGSFIYLLISIQKQFFILEPKRSKSSIYEIIKICQL